MNRNTHLGLGATGTTGRRIAARLRLRGAPVRAASRSSRARFDRSDPDTWAAALKDVAVAYVVPSPGPAHGFVAQAEEAGVRRPVLVTGRGADDWGDSAFGLDMRSAEEAVRGSSLEWTVLRAPNFAQNFDEDVFQAPLIAGELALPAGAVPEPFIDVEDVELSSRASGRPLAYRQITRAEYTSTLVDQGLSKHEADQVAEMFALMARGPFAGTTDDLATVPGRTPRTFEEYAVRTAPAGAWHER
ncbi:NAD(P)H-binding protein [Streptomyces sp. NPDC059255]|uniref:NAD(P)H-binding protein n=1 Tax=Streptomyces sp. NPDC059255 TaxID=3346793 RepID=UPI0036993EE2